MEEFASNATYVFALDMLLLIVLNREKEANLRGGRISPHTTTQYKRKLQIKTKLAKSLVNGGDNDMGGNASSLKSPQQAKDSSLSDLVASSMKSQHILRLSMVPPPTRRANSLASLLPIKGMGAIKEFSRSVPCRGQDITLRNFGELNGGEAHDGAWTIAQSKRKKNERAFNMQLHSHTKCGINI
ncbi:hypothetical protein SUGI_0559610 [Cryptomeria japonica]|nr:hypothetical protein SUGI_0559610 [Cryptomeria japonica]